MRFSLTSPHWEHRLLLRLGSASAFVFALFLVFAMAHEPAWAQLFPTAKPSATTNPNLALTSTAPAGSVVQTAQVRAEVMAYAPQGVIAGQSFWLGLQLQHAPHWHTYWQNPGDSGLPTQLRWTLPPGLTAAETIWPMPQKIAIGMLTNYGYENSSLLVVPVQVGKEFKASGTLSVQLQANWLVCRQECIPQEGLFSLSFPAQGASASQSDLFETALKLQPQPLLARDTPQDNAKASATASLSDQASRLNLQLKALPAAWRGQKLSLFPITPEIIVNSAVAGRDWTQRWTGDVWTAQFPVSPERVDSPQTLQWLVALGDPPADKVAGVTVSTPVTGTWPPPAGAAVSPQLSQALKDNAATLPPSASTPAGLGLWIGAVLGAFLGGLLLNLMPCVFPVLAIKVVGFAQPGHTRSEHRWAGWAYTTGVVGSFVILGGLMLALRAGGSQLGWGFQLQSPAVVAALAVLFTLLGLNLSGFFEFGQFVPSRLAAAQHRHPAVDALWSGVLAVVVASPCTAPFMGASLGLAIGLPAWQALPIFAAMGAGLALPYLAASLWPAFAKALPRPGAWMQTLRQLLAFPMFATVVWLLWVLGQQTGVDGASALLGLLVALAFVIWTWGLAGRTRWALSALGMALSLWLGHTVFIAQALLPVSGSSAEALPGAAQWQPWSPQTLQARLDAGQTVFVDFTAAWCVTCQFNKKTTFTNADLLKTFNSQHVALLRADWTRQDPAITQALNQLGRNGVPVYAVYAPGKPPRVLSELPSVQEITDALRQ
jgi:thiol:disulfide interchange protein/DsbC/DsbD-like thiol-disulfide interchange protein